MKVAEDRAAFLIWSPDYRYMSSGIRCLFLLCHHLNRLGYESYISGRHAPAELFTRFIDRESIDSFRARGGRFIAIYPEILKDNLFESDHVVRYLLNRPGVVSKTSIADFGADDYYIHYADEFVPEGVTSRRLWIPTLDTAVFHAREAPFERDGFVIYGSRVEPDHDAIPDWVSPRIIVSEREPRDPVTLAALYRSSRAIVTWERTAAVTEAIHCGCPAILVPNDSFRHEPVVRRNLGCGVALGWDPRQLARAANTLPVTRLWYQIRSLVFVANISRFAVRAQRHFGYQG